jgi:hypothetical protein
MPVKSQPEPTKQFAESLSGLIERVTFFNEENGFAVLKVKAKGHRDQVTVVGSSSATSRAIATDSLMASNSCVVIGRGFFTSALKGQSQRIPASPSSL